MTSPPETDRQFAYFFFIGSGSVADIDKAMDMSAITRWNAGDQFKSSSGVQLERRSSFWRLDSGLNDTVPLEDHLASLVTLTKPKKAAIKELSSRFQPWVKCVSYSYQSFGLAVPFDIQQELTRLGIGLCFSVYPLGDLHEEIIALRELAQNHTL